MKIAENGASGGPSANQTSLRTRLDAHFAALAAVCAVAGVGAAQKAEAGIIHSGPVSINIPSTTAGVYLNVVTGVNNPVPASVPGWDVNPWSTTGVGLFNPAAPTGGVYVGTAAAGTQASNLAPGTLIGAASLFGSNNSAAANSAVFTLNSSNNIIGFRFQNEANANQVHYGWMRISLSTGYATQPRTIVEYAYESVAGVGILAGAVPVTGVCCRGSTCNSGVTQANCLPSGLAGASYAVAAPACNAGANVTVPCCYANYNKVNGITTQDIFDFLGDWFAGGSMARFGSDGSAGLLSTQNIFDFLAAWFAGGC